MILYKYLHDNYHTKKHTVSKVLNFICVFQGMKYMTTENILHLDMHTYL